MSGENVEQHDDLSSQGSEWDILAEEQSVDIESSDTEAETDQESTNDVLDESDSEGVIRLAPRKLPSKIEGARRALVRRLAPNTMPNIETLIENTSRLGISYIDDLCENWPLFDHKQTVKIDGKEVSFPQYYPEIAFNPDEGRRDFSGFLSTPEEPRAEYDYIKSEIGKKNASIYAEACLDNPLVARIKFGVYPGCDNSDHATCAIAPDGTYHSVVRLIDESLPLSENLKKIQERLSGTVYGDSVKNKKQLECLDTINRAVIAYHEIGHDMDFLINDLNLQTLEGLDSSHIEDAIKRNYEKRSRDIECSKSVPELAYDGNFLIREDELRVILARRGFDVGAHQYDVDNIHQYNGRRYREMRSERIADEYARKAVCVRHRDHYFAKNQQERDQNPEKRDLPIYGEIVYMGTVMSEWNKFFDQELMGCGIISGQRLAMYEERVDPRIKVDPQTKKIELPDDFDYDSYQERQEAQPRIVEGIVKYNPHDGRFVLVDDSGRDLVIFGGDFYRQQNQDGEIELINGNFSGEEPTYRIRFAPNEQDRIESETVSQCGAIAFNDYLEIDTTGPNSILFINDNAATRVYLPEGGFASSEKMIEMGGTELEIPTEFYIYNGIPKVKIKGILYEVVPGSQQDLEWLEQKIIENTSEN